MRPSAHVPWIAAVLLCPLTAHADPPVVSLNWTRLPGAETCITARALSERVEQRLARPVFGSATQATLLIDGRVERTRASRAWHTTLVVTRPDGSVSARREFSSAHATCDAMGEWVVLAVSLLIDPAAALSTEPRESSAPPSASSAPPAAPQPQVLPPDAVPPVVASSAPPPPLVVQPRRALAVEVRAGAALALGAGPGAAGGVTGAVAVDIPFGRATVSVEVLGGFWPSGVTDPTISNESASLWLGAIGVAGCGAIDAIERLRVGACVGVGAADLGGSGHGYTSTFGASQWVTQVGVRARASWMLVGPLFVHAAVGADVSLPVVEFTAIGADGGPKSLSTNGPVIGAGELGLGVRWAP